MLVRKNNKIKNGNLEGTNIFKNIKIKIKNKILKKNKNISKIKNIGPLQI